MSSGNSSSSSFTSGLFASLEGNQSTTTYAPTMAPTNATDNMRLASPNEGQVLRNTFKVYGTMLAVIFLSFCYVRRAFPKPYTIRRWVDECKTYLADNQYGFISWVWNLSKIEDDTILEECGMDTLCFLRLLRMGYKVSCVGICNSFWLFIVYATSPPSPETAYITDGVAKISIANVPSRSARFIATVIAAYILFGYIMYLILLEFDWYTDKRHKFMMQRQARNYAIFCRNIPPEYRSNAALAAFFQQSLAPNSVLQADLRVTTPSLAKFVQRREMVIRKLEHAIGIQETTGKVPFHQASFAGQITGAVGVGRGKVESIPVYTEELMELNKEIKERIEAIEIAHQANNDIVSQLQDADEAAAEVAAEQEANPRLMLPTSSSPGFFLEHPEEDETAPFPDEETALCVVDEQDSLATTEQPHSQHLLGKLTSTAAGGAKMIASTAKGGVSLVASTASDGALMLASTATDGATKAVKLSTGVASKTVSVAASAANTALTIVVGQGDGQIMSAGFVSFTNLNAVQASLQMVQYDHPFEMEVSEAPAPDDVLWSNVGRSHKDLQLGLLISVAATVALCLLWTFPMTFVSSLSSIGGLRTIPFINELLNAAPWLEPVLQVLAPFLVVLLNNALPAILTLLSSFEGPVALATVDASTFEKLAAFMIIQTFFVSIVSGSVLKQLTNIIKNPTQTINLLAVSLPSQSSYFIQITFVSIVIPLGLEILRPVPIAFAFLRGFVGPRVTEKEREKAFIFLRPLADPSDFQHSNVLSQVVLNFMVLLVYAVMSPITSFVLAFCFFYLESAYRHQFVYIYPATSDSGGKMWTKFISILLVCMLVAEVTIIGLLALKKSIIGVPLMIPLIVLTALFNTYVHQQHFRIAEYLPAPLSTKADRQNGADMDMSFLQDAFVQPELKTKEAFPEVDDHLKRSLFGTCSLKEGLQSESEYFEANDATDYGSQAEAGDLRRSSRNKKSASLWSFFTNEERVEL